MAGRGVDDHRMAPVRASSTTAGLSVTASYEQINQNGVSGSMQCSTWHRAPDTQQAPRGAVQARSAPRYPYRTKRPRPAVQELLPSGNDLCWIPAKLLYIDELDVRLPVESVPQPLRVLRTHGNHDGLAGLQAVGDERHYAGGEVGGVVPQERLVPIALLRSGRCERDDPPPQDKSGVTDATKPVGLRRSRP